MPLLTSLIRLRILAMENASKNTDPFCNIFEPITGVILNRRTDNSVSLTIQTGEGTNLCFYCNVITINLDETEKDKSIRQIIR